MSEGDADDGHSLAFLLAHLFIVALLALAVGAAINVPFRVRLFAEFLKAKQQLNAFKANHLQHFFGLPEIVSARDSQLPDLDLEAALDDEDAAHAPPKGAKSKDSCISFGGRGAKGLAKGGSASRSKLAQRDSEPASPQDEDEAESCTGRSSVSCAGKGSARPSKDAAERTTATRQSKPPKRTPKPTTASDRGVRAAAKLLAANPRKQDEERDTLITNGSLE